MTIVPLDEHRDTPVVHSRRGPERTLALIEDLWQFAQRIHATEFVPGPLRRRPEAVLAAMVAGAERGLSAMESLRSIHVIDGRPTLSAEAMRALVFAAGHTIDIVESTDAKATVIGRRAGTETTSPPFTWTLDKARRARLANKQNWQTYPAAMLLARATADLCRALFPDVIAGLAVTEEITDEVEPPAATTRRTPPPRRSGDAGAAAPARTDRRLSAPPPAPATPSDSGLVPVSDTSTRPAQQRATTDLDGIPGADQPSWATPTPAAEPAQPADPALARRIHATIGQAFPDVDNPTRDRWRHALVAVVTRRSPDGPETSSAHLALDEQLELSKLLTNIQAGRASVADGPDATIELRVAGGWRYTITLDPPAVAVSRGDANEPAETLDLDPDVQDDSQADADAKGDTP